MQRMTASQSGGVMRICGIFIFVSWFGLGRQFFVMPRTLSGSVCLEVAAKCQCWLVEGLPALPRGGARQDWDVPLTRVIADVGGGLHSHDDSIFRHDVSFMGETICPHDELVA